MAADSGRERVGNFNITGPERLHAAFDGVPHCLMKTEKHRRRTVSDVFAVGDRDTMAMVDCGLSDRGLRVRTFTEPSDAIEAFAVASPRPAVLITGCFDCGCTGLGWIKACKQLEPGVKVIVWSGHEKITLGSLLAKAGVVPDIKLPKGCEGGDLNDVALAAELLLKRTHSARAAAK